MERALWWATLRKGKLSVRRWFRRTEVQRRGCTESGAATSRSERWAHPSRSSSPPASPPSLSACHPSPASGRLPATATARLSHTINKFSCQAVNVNKQLSFQRNEGDLGKNLKLPKPYMHSMIPPRHNMLSIMSENVPPGTIKFICNLDSPMTQLKQWTQNVKLPFGFQIPHYNYPTLTPMFYKQKSFCKFVC